MQKFRDADDLRLFHKLLFFWETFDQYKVFSLSNKFFKILIHIILVISV